MESTSYKESESRRGPRSPRQRSLSFVAWRQNATDLGPPITRPDAPRVTRFSIPPLSHVFLLRVERRVKDRTVPPWGLKTRPFTPLWQSSHLRRGVPLTTFLQVRPRSRFGEKLTPKGLQMCRVREQMKNVQSAPKKPINSNHD